MPEQQSSLSWEVPHAWVPTTEVVSPWRAQVMYAEPLAVRSGSGKVTPPLAPSCSLSARSDSNSSFIFMQQCSLAPGARPPLPQGL